MNRLKQPSIPRIIFHFFTSLLCVLLVSVLAQNGVLKKKPSVELQASTTLITYPCPPDGHSISRSCPSTADLQVVLTAVTKAFNKQPVYVYTVSGGRVVGEGSKVTWDLSAGRASTLPQ